MILYCDTSAWVKRYVDEDGSAAVAAAFGDCSAVALSRITWVEMMSAFARRVREQAAAAAAIDAARARLALDWPSCLVIELTQPLAELAGEYAEAFALRAYDSLQLASAQVLRQHSTEELRFACFDQRLRKAAAVLGMAVL